MKGWVYVITNKAMPGLVKVGYSSKDPELRAGELNHTGSPHPYVVEYDLLIEEPYEIEQKTHRLLASKREAKEWFRCSPEEAIEAIKRVSGNREIAETYKKAKRSKVEALRKIEIERRAAQLAKEQNEREAAKLLFEEDSKIFDKYRRQLEENYPPRPYWNYLIGGFILNASILAYLFPNMSNGAAMLALGLGSWIATEFLKNFFEGRRVKSRGYLAIERKREEEREALRARFKAERRV